MLLGVQAAASILLLVLATLFVRATIRAAQVDVGLDAEHLVSASVGLGRTANAARVRAYWTSALEKVAALPDVQSVALAEFPPFSGGSKLMVEDRGGQRAVTYLNRTSANYFETTGLRLVRGRAYTPEEVAGAARVAVVSEAFVRRHLEGRDPLGASLQPFVEEDAVVIGVVSDAIVARIYEGTQAAVYTPLSPGAMDFARLVVRTRGSPAQASRPLRDALRAVDADTVVRTRIVADGIEEELSVPRMVALISGTMAALAVVLAAIGLYGVTGALVGQRTREIGLRLALGAERRDVERLLVRDSLKPVLAGLTFGIVLALLGGRAISGALFGVPPHDPIAFGGAIVILLASAIAAVVVPTRRAARVDPAFVLRQ
jgi:putative ABC transport system permease protein